MLKVQPSPSWLQKHYVTRRVGLVIDKSLAKDGSFIPHIILHFENRKTKVYKIDAVFFPVLTKMHD